MTYIFWAVCFASLVLASSFHLSNSIMSRRGGVSTSTSTSTSAKPSHMRALAATVQGVGEEGCKLPSPSGVNALPLPTQAGVFFLVATGLYAATLLGIGGFEYLKSVLPGPITAWQGTWGLMGLFYALAGVSHFTAKLEFENIMPAWGAWGFWYLPGSKEFHVAWSGVAEFVLGLWLGLSTLANLFIGQQLLPALVVSPMSDAALGLLALTIGVTPANIYMV